MKKRNIVVLTLLFMCCTSVSSLATKMSPMEIFNKGHKAFDIGAFNEAIKLLEIAITDGVSDNIKNEASCMILESSLKTNNIEKINIYKNKCKNGLEKYPRSVGLVNDYTNTLSSPDIEKLTTLSKKIYKNHKIVPIFVMVETTGNVGLENYTTNLSKIWKINNASENNRIFILLALNDRKIRIETDDYLISIGIDSSYCSQIIDKMIPFFKKKNFGEGLYKGALEIEDFFKK